MRYELNVEVGNLTIQLLFENDLYFYFKDFFNKCISFKEPEVKIIFLSDKTLLSPTYDELIFKKHLKPNFDNNKLSINTSFSRVDFDFASKQGIAFFPGDDVTSRTGCSMLLQLLTSIFLLDYDCILVHSAGISIDGKGYLFPGISNIGKSTLAFKAKSKGYVVLSDDCVGIDVKNNYLFPTFFKNSSSNIKVPFHKCFFLSKGDFLKITSSDNKEYLYALIFNMPLVYFLKDLAKPFLGKIIKLASKTINQVQVKKLETRLEDDFLVILNEMEKS